MDDATQRSSNRIRSRVGTISHSPTGFSDVVGLPAALGNDADVAGLAEALHGAGKGYRRSFISPLVRASAADSLSMARFIGDADAERRKLGIFDFLK